MKQAIYVLGLLMLSTVSFQGYSQNQGAMRHDFVKRGNSVNELATGNYTVLSSTTSESGAKEIAAEIKTLIPDFSIEYKPDYRQAIADSWPQSIDDSVARNDWGWKPEYDLSKMTKEMLENLKVQK